MATRGAGVTAAAGTSLTHHLFAMLFTHGKSPRINLEHWEFPSHAFAHWRVFAPAAPRRAGTSISVSLSGLPLSWPVLIQGLVGHYPANYLISRRLILQHEFRQRRVAAVLAYRCLPTLSRSFH